LVSELSVVSEQEKVMLDECRELLAMAAKLEVLTLHSSSIPKNFLLRSDHQALKFEKRNFFL
jgi:hypothetical protein